MDPKIIFEDTAILILDKPSGWIVNDAKTTKNTPVVQTWLRENFNYPLAKSHEARSGIVHRLDKETSGILLVAKTLFAFQNLQSQFKGRVVEKSYIALVHGKVEPEEGEIQVPVGRLPWNRERFGVLPGGRESITRYKVSKHYNGYTLIDLSPKTGRTHQIRIHMKYLGHPLVSDEFYAGRKTARSDRNWCPRLFLHAASISFKDPHEGKRLTFQSDLPSQLKDVLNQLSA